MRVLQSPMYSYVLRSFCSAFVSAFLVYIIGFTLILRVLVCFRMSAVFLLYVRTYVGYVPVPVSVFARGKFRPRRSHLAFSLPFAGL